MAEEMNSGFKKVTRSFNRSNGQRRQPAHVVVDPSGLTEASVTVSEWLLAKAATAGEAPAQFDATFAVNEKTGLVAVHIAQAGEEGATPALVTKSTRRVSLHLGGVFAEYPALAANYARKCPVKRQPDGTIIIAISSGVAYRQGASAQAKREAAPTTED